MSKYPPCMMYAPREREPKHVKKETNVLREFIKFQEFMDNMNKKNKEADKKPDAPPTGKGVWHWVEEETPTKLSVLESMAILLLLSIPVAAAEVYGGTLLFRMATGG